MSYHNDYYEGLSSNQVNDSDFIVSVFASDGNKYQFNSSGIVSETIGLQINTTYKFDLSDSSNLNHPMFFSSVSNGIHNGGAKYTTGVNYVGTAGTTGSYISITPTSSTGDLYYFCNHHLNMGGKIRILSKLNSSSNEIFISNSSNTSFDVIGIYTSFTLTNLGDSSSWSITGVDIGTDTLTGFKRLEFDDGVLALDVGVGDTAGQAYRMYQAAFARTPDMPGVAYHMNDMESNGLSIKQIATNFMASPEFKVKYGESPSDDDFINALYQNVLSRGASESEVSWYQERIDSGVYDRPQLLVNFAESPENVTLVGSAIENGIWLESS